MVVNHHVILLSHLSKRWNYWSVNQLQINILGAIIKVWWLYRMTEYLYGSFASLSASMQQICTKVPSLHNFDLISVCWVASMDFILMTDHWTPLFNHWRMGPISPKTFVMNPAESFPTFVQLMYDHKITGSCACIMTTYLSLHANFEVITSLKFG